MQHSSVAGFVAAGLRLTNAHFDVVPVDGLLVTAAGNGPFIHGVHFATHVGYILHWKLNKIRLVIDRDYKQNGYL